MEFYMLRSFLKAKIRDIKVTGAHLEYEGSITLDENFIEQAGILPYEEVQVLNLENGNRFNTYVIKGKRGSCIVELNGPAARMGVVGDRIMVLTFAYLAENEIAAHAPRVVSGNK
jgi:aspartate 1-decarboxylase